MSWEPFDALGEVIYYDRMSATEIVDKCKDANIIITNKTPISSAVIDSAKGLSLIAVTATGYNIIDISEAKKRAISVCNVPSYGTHSVAQHAFALLLGLSNHVGENAASVQSGEWYSSPDWSYSKHPL